MLSVASMYFSGLGVKQDYREAVRWYRPAAKQGNPLAQHSLGISLLALENIDEAIESGSATTIPIRSFRLVWMKSRLRNVLASRSLSVREEGMLESKGCLRFSAPCHTWVNEALTAPRLSLLTMSPAIALERYYLPGPIHGDPADPILVAAIASIKSMFTWLVKAGLEKSR